MTDQYEAPPGTPVEPDPVSTPDQGTVDPLNIPVVDPDPGDVTAVDSTGAPIDPPPVADIAPEDISPLSPFAPKNPDPEHHEPPHPLFPELDAVTVCPTCGAAIATGTADGAPAETPTPVAATDTPEGWSPTV